MFWAKTAAISVGPAYQTFYLLVDDPGVYTEYGGIFSYTDGTSHCHMLDTDGSFLNTTTPVVSQWAHYTWVQTGTSQLLYRNGRFISGFGQDRSTDVLGFELAGGDTFSDGNLDLAYFRSWQAELTIDEIDIEMQATSAVRTSDLWMDTPLVSNLNDVSGNGRNWTQVGSGTFVAGPSFPSNNSATNAVALNANDSLTLDMNDGAYAWYSYTPTTTDEVVVGFWAFYDFTKVDDLLVAMFGGTPAALTEWPNSDNPEGGSSVPYQIPVTFGDTVYIQLLPRNFAATPFTSDISISTNAGPTGEVAIGSIAVNDDLSGFPLAMLDNTTGVPSLFLNFPASGSGVVMPTTGQVMMDDGTTTGSFLLFQSDYQTSITVPYPTQSGAIPPLIIATDGSALFYAKSNGGIAHGIVTTYDLSGNLVSTFDLGAGSLRAGAPNSDNTIFYYTRAGVGSDIKRWDLVNDVALTDLPTGVANYTNGVDLLVLGDGTLINFYHRNLFPDLIHQIDQTTGATLNTYTMPVAPVSIDHIATAIDDPNSFWVWLHNGTGAAYASTFYNIKVSDGSLLTNVDAQQFEQGQYGGDFTTTPNARFGHSNSCPFWIVRVGITPPTPTPSSNTREYLIRRERWFPVVSQEQKRLFFHKLQLYFESGTGINTGQGSDPLVELDWSDDGGHTWSHLHLLESGRMGEYKRRIIQRMMGSSRERIYRVAVSDPVQWSLIDSFFDITEGTS